MGPKVAVHSKCDSNRRVDVVTTQTVCNARLCVLIDVNCKLSIQPAN